MSTDRVVLQEIPFQPDIQQLLAMLHLDGDGSDAEAVRVMLAEATAIAKPKAVFRIGYIDEKGDDYVVVNGVRLTSRVLRVNLDAAHRVFAYVATAGVELEQWANAKNDILERYWADGIMLMAVRSAVSFMTAYIHEHYRPGRLSRMNPGSLPDWPLREQKPLFALVGDVQDSIGVYLTDSYLMIPRKSVSGVQFPVEESFESCQLCGREFCPGRRAPYDPTLFDRKYRLTRP